MGAQTPLDTILRTVADSERRRVLVSLCERDPQAIESLYRDADRQMDEDELQRFRVRLHHNHLPRLEAVGAITLDDEENLVYSGPEFDRVMDFLRRVDDTVDIDAANMDDLTKWRSSPRAPIDILLVEDNPGDVRLTEEAFDDARIQNTLSVVRDGGEALEFLFQRGEYTAASRPGLILLDPTLPRTSGADVLAAVKEDPDLQSIPVIALTETGQNQDIVRSHDLRVDAYLTKPLDSSEFLETVRTFEDLWLSIIQAPESN